MARKPVVSPKTPFENVEEVLDSPDIQAYRAYNPLSQSRLGSTLAARSGARRNQIRDDYGAYSGIPSQVARNAMRDAALADVDESEGLALAEGDTQAQAMRLAQLQSLATLTAKRKQSGYNTQILQPQQSTFWPSLFGGIAGGATLALGARAQAPKVPSPWSGTGFWWPKR
jgi:hypothetical protein